MAQLTSTQGSTNGNGIANLDRNDPQTARRIIEKALPEKQIRTTILRLLADMIKVANENPRSWGVSLHKSEVALNVGGGIYAFSLSQSKLYLVWMKNESIILEGEEQAYKNYPNTRKRKMAPSEWVPLLPQYQPLIELFITYANGKSKSPLAKPLRVAHSPGVLRYLEQALDIKLPDPNNTINYWAFQYNPNRYDLPKAISQLKEDSWSTGGSDIQPGDRALFWQAKGGRDKRGIFCLAEIIDSPTVIKPLHPEFFLVSEDVPAKLRVTFRYVPCSKLPLWFDDLPEPLRKMSVVQGQGSAFKVTLEQWEVLMETIGGWPEDHKVQRQSPEVMLQEFPLNTILYGPPGTGKTYETAFRAVQIVDGVAPDERGELMQRYRELQQVGRIGFVTFHQSYSYEDFVEGIRPVMDQNSTGSTSPRYEIADGILKRMALEALAASLRPLPRSAATGPTFVALWQTFLEKIEDEPDWTIPGIGSSEYSLTIKSSENVNGENIKGRAKEPYSASRKNVEKVWNGIDVHERPTHNRLNAILGVGAHTNLIGAIVLALRELTREKSDIPSNKSLPIARDTVIDFLERSEDSGFILGSITEMAQEGKPQGNIPTSALEELLAIFREQITNEPNRRYRLGGKTDYRDYVFRLGEKGKILYDTLELDSSTTTATRSRGLLYAHIVNVWTQFSHQEHVSASDVSTVVQNLPAYAVLFNELKRIQRDEEGLLPLPEAPDETSADDAIVRETPRYVLIVDEINRGNISKILGELITLLEDDKRIGKDNELIVTLPYSREPFSLPSNLYLIGTMNTADKSLALLDIALRRRFEFQELTPDFDKCEPALSPKMRSSLNELNRRITLRKDRDHRIGHAFFMKVGNDVTKFDHVFRRKIIPLLQEYFFNDWAGLLYVLGEPNGGGFIRAMRDAENEGARNRWQWFSDDENISEFSPCSQLIKNYKLNGNPGELNESVVAESGEKDDTDAVG